MKATTVFAAYNVEQYIEEALQSAINQSFGKKYPRLYEILIINDGSTDKTGNLLKKMQRKNPEENIKIITTQNKKLPFARNLGIRASKGEYLVFSDADDILEPNAVEECVNFLEKNKKIGLVYSNQRDIDKNGNELGLRTRDKFHKNFDYFIEFFMFAGHVKAINKELTKKIRFDIKFPLGQDWDYILKIHNKIDIGHIAKTLYNYRVIKTNATHSKKDQMIECSKKILLEHFKRKEIDNVKIISKEKNNIAWYERIVNEKYVSLPKKFVELWVNYAS